MSWISCSASYSIWYIYHQLYITMREHSGDEQRRYAHRLAKVWAWRKDGVRSWRKADNRVSHAGTCDHLGSASLATTTPSAGIG